MISILFVCHGTETSAEVHEIIVNSPFVSHKQSSLHTLLHVF